MKRISFETAKLAAEKGYKKGCDKTYTAKGENLWPPYYGDSFKNGDDNGDSMYEAPYQAELQEWLREEHGVNVLVYLDETLSYYWAITGLFPETVVKECQISSNVWCGHYENCLEAGLQAALELL